MRLVDRRQRKGKKSGGGGGFEKDRDGEQRLSASAASDGTRLDRSRPIGVGQLVRKRPIGRFQRGSSDQ